MDRRGGVLVLAAIRAPSAAGSVRDFMNSQAVSLLFEDLSIAYPASPSRCFCTDQDGKYCTSNEVGVMPAVCSPPAQNPPPMVMAMWLLANRPCSVPPPPTSGEADSLAFFRSIMYCRASTTAGSLAVGVPQCQPPWRPCAAGSFL